MTKLDLALQEEKSKKIDLIITGMLLQKLVLEVERTKKLNNEYNDYITKRELQVKKNELEIFLKSTGITLEEIKEKSF